jgi:pimeloyl-ACP methyl ester carboxylesterase
VLKVATPGGAEVAVHDLGGEGPDLLMLHATGFHGRAWLPVAEALRGRYHCLAMDERGHGDSGTSPGLDFDWRTMADDVLGVADELGLHRPFGIGHSCGATLLLLAEQARPGTFQALYCYEPIMSPVEDPPPPQPNPMAAGARRRRDAFASRDAAYAAFAGKPPLSVLAPDALEAYVDFGFDDLEDGTVRLKCRPEHEALVYEHGLSHSAYRDLPDVGCPVTVACGELTDTVGAAAAERLAQRLPRGRTEVLAGLGHFGPLEDPDAVAAAVLRAFDR